WFVEYYPREWVDCSDPASQRRTNQKRTVGSELSTGNLEMASVQRGGCPLRKGIVNHPVCSSKCVTTVMRQLGTRLAIERARAETLPLRLWEKHGVEQRLRGEASDAESG